MRTPFPPHQSAQKQSLFSSKGSAMKIILSALAIVVVAIALIIFFTRGLTDIARDQILAIKKGNIEQAYKMTSKAFQQETSLDTFKSFADKYTVFKDFKNVSFDERKRDGNTGYLHGTIESTNGVKMTIEYQFIKEDNQWKIQALRLTSTGADLASLSSEAVTDKSGAAIHGILISNDADKEGYVETEKGIISKAAPKIYATIQVVAPKKGITVTTTLTHVPTGGSIGPTSGTVNKTGNIMKAFSFTRTVKEWPVGEYEVTAVLSTGAKKTVKFTIN